MIIKVLLVITVIASQYFTGTFAVNLTNVALGKPCGMISQYSNDQAEYGVDGYMDTYFKTLNHINPWWYVDLGEIYDIEYIEIVNRAQFGSELRHLYIYVAIVLHPLPTHVAYYEGPGSDGEHLIFNFTDARGRYVKLVTIQTNRFHLAEVMVFAPEPTAPNLIKSGYPKVMRGRHFTSSNGSGSGTDWIVGPHFRPVFDSMMYIAVGYSSEFFADYYINDLTDGATDQIVYECKKYEEYDNETIFLWAFEKINKQYDDPIPSLCDLCSSGEVQYKLRLKVTNGTTASPSNETGSENVSVSSVIPGILEPKILTNCIYQEVSDKTSKGCSFVKNNWLVTLILVLLCSKLCHLD